MNIPQSLPTVYDPGQVEKKWYQYWKDKGCFTPDGDQSKKMFSLVMPPPNVTGALHLGHALDNTIQDILTRWHRMQGHNTLWLPGTDHAGIATQAKVEESLAAQGISKHDLGREGFLDKVWEWKHLYGNTITDQLSLLGSSCDWSRERFTMDEGCSRAVREVFVNLYEKGLIYQGDYIINWCPRCRTAISDIEVEHDEQQGSLWHIKYPISDSDEYVVVATTRPETMLGDTGVAVHPKDERYKDLVGKKARLPLVDRLIPVFADDYVDQTFGTGAVKVTPAHDPNDFEMGLRHNLDQIAIMDNHGVLNENAGRYQGLTREEGRNRVIEDLEQRGLLLKIDSHRHAVGHCQRCSAIIEPMISRQWFVKMKPLAKPAIQKVLDGEIKFIPERFTRIYINWMENIRDWCISRQLWWGHRIPVWYCRDCGEVICSRFDPKNCTSCGSGHLHQDEDVLDTWFSSALWPFSTLGWPEETEDLKYYYPTSVLVTGRDIIFFWVARMIFSGIEQTGQIPFREVNIHGLILDGQGRKMSKSLGNGIDPIEVINKYGADTLRYSLITGVTPGNDVRFNWEKVENTRNFANKIWNASRFAIMNLRDYEKIGIVDEELQLVDRWAISRMNQMLETVNTGLSKYDLGESARELYEFIWDELCDWYIELAKPRLFNPAGKRQRQVVQNVLNYLIQTVLKALHPFMPFITEEIYQNLPGHKETIMLEKWPESDANKIWPEAIENMKQIMTAIRLIRNIKAEFNVSPGSKVSVVMLISEDELRAIIADNLHYIQSMANVESLDIQKAADIKPAQAAAAVTSNMEIYVPLKGLIDTDKEIGRLQKELKNTQIDLDKAESKLNNKKFLSRAPAEVIEKERTKMSEAKAKKEGIIQRLQILSGT